MRVVTIPVGPLETNCYLVYDESSMEGVIIDPGYEAETIKAHIAELGLKILAIVDTHGHHDHVGENDCLRDYYQVPLYIHKADEVLFQDPQRLRETFARDLTPQRSADVYLEADEKLEIGPLSFDVYHTPGHTLGGVCLVNHDEKVCFCGDTIFKGTVGRTDFWGGSYDDLLYSIQVELKDLADDLVVYPGHGPSTTMGYERRHNPYFRASR